MRKVVIAIIYGILLANTSTIFASNPGTSAGLTLIETVGARPAALGEAFSAVRNDIQALSYNPASLKTLERGNASLLYEKGMIGDSYGSLMVGTPYKNSAVGLSLQYYNGVTMNMNDGVNPNHSVVSEKDTSLSLGWAGALRDNINIGVAGKYFSSQLVEQYSAHAFAVDMGLGVLHGPWTFGLALQNFGSQLTYASEGDNLPRTARLGAGWTVSSHWLILGDASYLMNEQSWSPGAGVEFSYSLVALRVGYRGGNDQNNFSAGAGVHMGAARLDYAYGMSKDLTSEQRVSLSLSFGGNAPQTFSANGQAPKNSNVRYDFSPTAKGQKVPLAPAFVTPMSSGESRKPVSYIVKEGDTYKSISMKFFGRTDMWQNIYNYNKALTDNAGTLRVGDKIFIPKN